MKPRQVPGVWSLARLAETSASLRTAVEAWADRAFEDAFHGPAERGLRRSARYELVMGASGAERRVLVVPSVCSQRALTGGLFGFRTPVLP